MTDEVTEQSRAARWYLAATLLVAAIATWQVVSTYKVLSHSVDSPVHITAGLEWLQHGTHRIHAENPPLARVAVGLGPHLAGIELPASGTAYQRGVEVLYSGGHYLRTLTSARLGQLPFFLLAIWLVWLWARRLGGPRAAFLAAATFCALPPVLGHAGLATTDVAFLSTFALAMLTTVRWFEQPSLRRAVWMGLGIGVALSTKYSTLVFFPPCAAVTLALWFALRPRGTPIPWRAWLLGAAVVAVLAPVVVWGAFRFDVGKLRDNPKAERVIADCFPDEGSVGRRVFDWVAQQTVPAPDGVFGVLVLYSHTTLGHPAYALGRTSQQGFWYFYPLAFLVKTPLVFMVLSLAALIALLCRARALGWRYLAPVGYGLAIVVSLMGSTINIGLRHGLAAYPFFAIGVGLGIDALLRQVPGRVRRAACAAIGVLVLWQSTLIFSAFPDYIAWFNRLAGSEPGTVLVDSDLDWGLDVIQLRDWFEGKDVEQLHIAYFGNVRICEAGLPPLTWLPPAQPTKGWIAISETYYRDHWHKVYTDPCDRWGGTYYGERGGYDWLREHEPVAWAGKSIRIYHIE